MKLICLVGYYYLLLVTRVLQEVSNWLPRCTSTYAGGTFTFLSEDLLVVTFHAENVEFVGLRDPDLVLC
jgi:hypothetical protein